MNEKELKRIKKEQFKLYKETKRMKNLAWNRNFEEAKKIREEEVEKYKKYEFLKKFYNVMKEGK